jgi:signal transduction histidine kinase
MFATPLTNNEPLPRLLIVDDDPFICQLMRNLFRDGYEVTIVSGGREALDKLAGEPFDAVLLDIMMPIVSGLDVLEHIRKTPALADLPVILMSARSGGPDVAKGLELGANDYVTKPIDTPVIRARVAGQIRLKQERDEQKAELSHLQNQQEMKDRFFHIASHDLKGPLTNIRIAQFQLRDLVGDDPDASDALDAIENTVEAMQEVVDEFLDTAALQQGALKLNLQSLPVEDLLWDVVTQYSMSAQRKEMALVVGETSGIVRADMGLARQILGNLVSNAIKYSPLGTSVTLSSEVIGDSVRIKVTDEGPGIAADERELLFQAFSKLSARPTGGESSTGLGLWITRQLATVHGGVVGMDSAPGGGSVFWVELPVSKG